MRSVTELSQFLRIFTTYSFTKCMLIRLEYICTVSKRPFVIPLETSVTVDSNEDHTKCVLPTFINSVCNIYL